MKLICRIFAVALPVLLGTGCGYNIGSMTHPELKTVAVAPVTNNTAIYNVASDMRMMINEAFTQDGSLKLVSQAAADCIVYITITEASFANITDESYYDDELFYRPIEWRTKVNADYKVIIPGQGTPLFSGKVSGTADFQAPGDIETSRLRAVRQACHVAARQIVYAVTEGW